MHGQGSESLSAPYCQYRSGREGAIGDRETERKSAAGQLGRWTRGGPGTAGLCVRAPSIAWRGQKQGSLAAARQPALTGRQARRCEGA